MVTKWLLEQWNDIKGNVKFYVLCLCGTAGLALIGVLTHGLTWQQQAGLLFLFAAILAWAIVATVLAVARSKSQVSERQMNNHPKALPLSSRAFETCNALDTFVDQMGTRPSEDNIYNATSSQGAKAYEERVTKEVVPWDERIQAGYLLRFRDSVIRLRHELVLALNHSDDDLDKALSRAESVPDDKFGGNLRVIAQKIRFLASKLSS